ncbi:MAG: hypothetical protein HYW23_01670 [Candidatus Aenigmarchaeota archaeon]|nr:hypothetical protein [Candidatus Aenigmarchaeota archaeon]
MAERIITLRPHHIDRFVSYYYKFQNMFDNPHALEARYGSEMVKQLKTLYGFVASGGTGEEYILVRSGLDSICSMCPIKRDACSEPDSLSVWNGSGKVIEEMDLRDGFLYSISEFLEKVRQLYSGRNPVNK